MVACTDKRWPKLAAETEEAPRRGSLPNYAMFTHFAGLYRDRSATLANSVTSCIQNSDARFETRSLRALDVGASDGVLALEFGRSLDARWGLRSLLALEPEVDALPRLARRQRESDFEFSMMAQDLDGFLNDPAMAAERFDIITAIHSAYHFRDLAGDIRALRNRLVRGGRLVVIADSAEGRFYQFIEDLDRLVSPATVGLFGGRVFGESVAHAVGGTGYMAQINQTLVFRSAADVLLGAAFVGRYDLLSLSSRTAEVLDLFEDAFGPLPAVVTWPEICVAAGPVAAHRERFRDQAMVVGDPAGAIAT